MYKANFKEQDNSLMQIDTTMKNDARYGSTSEISPIPNTSTKMSLD